MNTPIHVWRVGLAALVLLGTISGASMAQTPAPDTRQLLIEDAQADKLNVLHPYAPTKGVHQSHRDQGPQPRRDRPRPNRRCSTRSIPLGHPQVKDVRHAPGPDGDGRQQ
jgi:hypothetical protein